MWRRLVSSSSSHLKTLALSSRTNLCRSTTRFPAAANNKSSASLLHRYFSDSSSSANTTSVKKTVGDLPPIVTGHEQEELEAELQGKRLDDIDHPEGPFGTKEAPAVIKSTYDRRVVGCPGGEGEDEHDVVWFWLEKGKPQECPVCTQYFTLLVPVALETNWLMVVDLTYASS
ncbi:hypothetical protein ACFE04_014674 [Oxalis oulophora]